MASGFSLASIPSPNSIGLEIGPLTLRWYGLSIAFGVLAAVWLVSRRAPARRFAPEVGGQIAFPAVVGGFIGARLYHVITDSNWADWYKVWEGGLGIPGGILGGMIAVVIYSRAKGWPLPPLFDIATPALPLAQAIGRWGNWFNQELFGGPLDAPWGLEISPEHRPAEYASVETFHPTFLYESIWNFGLLGLLLWIDSKKKLKPGRLFYVYMIGYGVGRLWIESIRIDHATEIAGIRINIWTMSVVVIVGIIGVWYGRLAKGESDTYRRDNQPGGSDSEHSEVDADSNADADDDGDAEADVDEEAVEARAATSD